MRSFHNPLLLLLISLCIISLNSMDAKADPNGRITGTVVDKASNEAVVNANVVIVGEKLGANTDIFGKFTILNIPPGVYAVEFLCVGYHNIKLEDVFVAANLVTELNVELISADIELESVEILIDRPMIQLDNSAGSVRFDKARQENIRPESVQHLERNTKGFKVDEDGQMHVRGSRAGDVQDNPQMRYYHPRIMPPPPPPAPLQTGETYNKFEENQFIEVLEHPLSTFSIDVDQASYANMRRFISNGSLPPKDAVRIEEFINYFDYDYPQPVGEDPVSIITELSECPWNSDNRLFHIGIQGKKLKKDNLPPSNMVFLLDVSGSMNNRDKLPLLKSSFQLLVDELRKEDRVAIVVYAGAAGIVLESTRGDEKMKIREAIDRLSAGGSTAGGAGIQLAYKTARDNFIKKGNNRVILATDGDFNVGVTNNDDLVNMIREEANKGVFLTVLGFGTGNLQDERMEQIADKGDGNYHYIDNILEGKKALVKEMGGLFTIAKDVKLQIEFNPANVVAYRLIGYENRALADRDFNDDKKDAGEIGAGHTVTAIYEIITSGMSSDFEPRIDPLKYRDADIKPNAKFEDEVMTVKLRYKPPTEDTSKLMVKAVKDEHLMLKKASDNFRFSAAVAEFGMLLRGSQFKANANYDQVVELAKGARGNDAEGYRAEFIKLVETAQLLDRKNVER